MAGATQQRSSRELIKRRFSRTICPIASIPIPLRTIIRYVCFRCCPLDAVLASFCDHPRPAYFERRLFARRPQAVKLHAHSDEWHLFIAGGPSAKPAAEPTENSRGECYQRKLLISSGKCRSACFASPPLSQRSSHCAR